MSDIRSAENTRDRIAALAGVIEQRLRESITDIQAVNEDIHVLSVNAKIQAARAGDAGRGFAVVADMVRGMVSRTTGITDRLQSAVAESIGELLEINRFLGTQVRGDRLAQVAATIIDIVDRNLYERSCDVRWWATEDALVQALAAPDSETAARASRRMGTILDSYTVYRDLVLCDSTGRVIANGRPRHYDSTGSSVFGEAWFSQALTTRRGDEYGFQGLHACSLVGGTDSLVFSCAVRRDADPTGPVLGVLGIIFDWAGLGYQVVAQAENTLSEETAHPVHAHIFTEDGLLIASREGRNVLKPMKPETMEQVRGRPGGSLLPELESGRRLVAGFARSRGFETYRSGWYAIVQEEQTTQ